MSEGLAVKAGTVKWINMGMAGAAVAWGVFVWVDSRISAAKTANTATAAVQAVVGDRLKRAEDDIAANKAEATARISGLEAKVDALRADVNTKFESVSRDLSATRSDVSWIRGMIEGGARIGAGDHPLSR